MVQSCECSCKRRLLIWCLAEQLEVPLCKQLQLSVESGRARTKPRSQKTRKRIHTFNFFVCNRHALGTCWPGYIAELHRQLHLREREHAGLAVFLFLAERPRTISVDGLHYDRTPSCNRRATNRHRVRIARAIFRCKGPRAYRWLIPAIVLRVINPRVLARSAIATAPRHSTRVPGYPAVVDGGVSALGLRSAHLCR